MADKDAAARERRSRAGKGSTVGGQPAAEALASLVDQFSERSAFVRELVQNALDAGAGRVELQIDQEKRRLRIAVVDDGEGMDRATIEGYLLTLFRSSKEDDLTKIGKFGIGFVSLFVLKPELVVVDTARDGIHHRVVFDAEQRYTLARVDEPFEGTTVALYLRSWGKPARELAEELRGALHYWCRFAQAEVLCEARGQGWSWEEEVEHAFTVDTRVSLLEERDGFRAVLGYHPEESPPVGYYNRGLTLLEAPESVLPGVSFRVEARELEHTLTRDNVIRDGHHARVIAELKRLAEGPLLALHLQRLEQAPPQDYGALLLDLHYAPIPADRPLFRSASGGRLSLEVLRGGLLDRLKNTPLLWAPGSSAVVDALEREGRPVLLGPPDAHAEATLLARHLPDRAWVDAEASYVAVEAAPGAPLFQQAGVLPARFEGSGAALKGRLAVRLPALDTLLPASALGKGQLIVNVDHPAVARLSALDPTGAARWLRLSALRACEEASR